MSGRLLVALLHRLLWVVFACYAFAQPSLGTPYWITLALMAASLGCWLGLRLTRDREVRLRPREPVEVEPPVVGRWSALNSPADKVPSHGTHALGQSYAIDITSEGEGEGARPGPVLLWPFGRRPEAYPAFGAPLFAPADATVVGADDAQRDHLTRTSLPGVLYLLVVESVARSLGGARRVTGNHLVLDLGDGVYAMYAHLRQGSLKVRPGDRVTAGQTLAACGNSGNSSEPHLHFQLMDAPDPKVARGIPFRWRGVGVPANREVFEVAVSGAR